MGFGGVQPVTPGPAGLLHASLLGLVSDGGVHSLAGAPACADPPPPRGRACAGADLVVHAFHRRRDTLPTPGWLPGRADRTPYARVGSVWVATGRWIVIVAGIARSGLTTCSSTEGPPLHLERRAGRARRIRAGGDRPSSSSPPRPARARIVPRTACCASTSARPPWRQIVRHSPTGSERTPMSTPGLGGASRGLSGGAPARSPSTRRVGPIRWRFAPERPRSRCRGDRRGGARQLHVAEREKYPHVT